MSYLLLPFLVLSLLVFSWQAAEHPVPAAPSPAHTAEEQSFPPQPPKKDELQTAEGSPVLEAVRSSPEKSRAAEGTTYRVVRVIDGDTIEVSIDGVTKTLRYIGIDTPETVHPSKPVGCFGAEASAKNRALVENKYVQLKKDVSETDKYGRLLRYVYVGETFVNHTLVLGGYAHASTYPPDVSHTDDFLRAEKEAREARRGLWGDVCASSPPASTVSTPSTSGASGAPSASCTIKGNISSGKEKIYHLIGCKSYEKTVINESAGERWFCSEKEALDAGWRKALNC